MNYKPKVSVIVPVYNTAQFLPRCLDSILKSTYQELEIICINDGSTDNSAAILEQYAAADSRIIIENKVNAGVSAARNTGLRISTGDFVAFVDSDDWIHSQCLEILLSIALETDANVVVCNYKRVVDEQEDVLVDSSSLRYQKLSLLQAVNDKTVKRFVWGRLYSRSVVEGIKFSNDIAFKEDTVFNLDAFCSKSDLRLYITDCPLYYYFSRPESAVNTLGSRALEPSVRYCLSRLRDDEPENIKTVFLLEALKGALAYRYGTMYEPDRDELQFRAKEMITECLCTLKTLGGGIPFAKRIQYYCLSCCPSLYRAFRIKDDKTLLIWEKEQKRKLR